jgi:hypothetical protein
MFEYTVKGLDKKAFLDYLDLLFSAKKIGIEEYGRLYNTVSAFPDLAIANVSSPMPMAVKEFIEGLEALTGMRLCG